MVKQQVRTASSTATGLRVTTKDRARRRASTPVSAEPVSPPVAPPATLVARTPAQRARKASEVIEFDSVEQAIATHDGPAYKAALDALGDGAEREIRIVEGV